MLPVSDRVASWTVAAFLVCASASAQESNSTTSQSLTPVVEEIIVTAQRREESIQDVPISISALSGDQMDKLNVRGIEDVFSRAPNVSAVTNGSRDRKEISIRGISNQLDPYTNIRSATYSFYIDEFNVVAGTNNPQILDLERVEVLRGPQGTYFGRNSIGGAINVTTRKPNDDWFAQIGLGYSSFDTREASAIVNAPIVEGTFAIRGSGLFEASDGNIGNINSMGGGNDSDYKTGRLIARWTPTDFTTSDTTFSYTREKVGMRSGVPTGHLTLTWRNIYYGGAPGLADPDGVGFYPHNDDQTNFDRPQEVGTEFWYVSNRTTTELSEVALTAVVGYLSSDVENFGDVDGGSIDFFYEDGVLNRESLSGELRLQSLTEGKLEWSVGANLGQDEGSTDQVSRIGTRQLFGLPVGFRINDVKSRSVNDYYALFGEATYNFSDRFGVTLGARYSNEEESLDYTRISNEVPTADFERSASFDDFSPKLSITYRPTDETLTYATVARGFKSGGIQTAPILQTEFYDPEKLWSYEIGLKQATLQGRLRFDISGFYSDWTNVQQSIRFNFVDDDGVLQSATGIDNAASATAYGVDASIDVQANDEFSLNLHAGWVEGEFDRFPDALIDGQQLDLSGKPLINAPEWTFGALMEYRRPAFENVEGFGIVSWNYRSATYSNGYAYLYESYPFISPSYHNVDVRLGVENERFSVIAYAENLLDEDYYYNVYEKAFYGGVHLEPSVQRFGISASYRFN